MNWWTIWTIFFMIVVTLAAIPLFLKDLRQLRKDRAFFSDREAVEKLVKRIDEVMAQGEEFRDAHSQHWEHLKKLEKVSKEFDDASWVCIHNPRPSRKEIANVRLAAKELVTVCQQGIEASHKGIDYEKIMADTFHVLTGLK